MSLGKNWYKTTKLLALFLKFRKMAIFPEPLKKVEPNFATWMCYKYSAKVWKKPFKYFQIYVGHNLTTELNFSVNIGKILMKVFGLLKRP